MKKMSVQYRCDLPQVRYSYNRKPVSVFKTGFPCSPGWSRTKYVGGGGDDPELLIWLYKRDEYRYIPSGLRLLDKESTNWATNPSPSFFFFFKCTTIPRLYRKIVQNIMLNFNIILNIKKSEVRWYLLLRLMLEAWKALKIWPLLFTYTHFPLLTD